MTDTTTREAVPPKAGSSPASSWHWIKIWDVPTRLFHWSLVALVVAAYYTARTGRIDTHFLCGYAILTLVTFRILWGIVGSETSRFTSFVRSPLAAIAHLRHVIRREPEVEVGHNPAGAYMVLALLGLLLIQTGTGLFSNDGLFESGPLAGLVSSTTSDTLTILHGYVFDLIVIAVVAHVGAIAVYAVLLRQNLLRPMITGWARFPGAVKAPKMMPFWFAVVLLVIAGAAVRALIHLN